MLEVKTLTNRVCELVYMHQTDAPVIHDLGTVCVYNHKNFNIGVCTRSFGFPLVGSGKLIGILYWMPGCYSGLPAAYTRVSEPQNLRWIRKHVPNV